MTRLATENTPAVHEEIFRSLLRTPHHGKAIDETIALHKAQFDRDPHLYGKLAVYAVAEGNCAVRDIQDVFVATLFASPYEEHRSAAWVMLQDMPPYRVARILDYVTGYYEIVHKRSNDKWELPKNGENGVVVKPAHFSEKHPDLTKRGKLIPEKTIKLGKALRAKMKTREQQITVKTYQVYHPGFGHKSINRYLRSAIKHYLSWREREENRSLMEGALVRARKFMRRLYAKSRTLPMGDEKSWVNRYLFHEEVPTGSRMSAIQQILGCTDPAQQAKIAIDNNIPLPTLCSLVDNVTPSLLVAMVYVMSPQEVLANQNLLRRHGAFNNPELKAMIHEKLAKIMKGKKGKVDALKGQAAAATEGLDEDTKALLVKVTDTELKKYDQIVADTLILVDISGSMQAAIEIARGLAPVICQAAENPDNVWVYTFNAMGVERKVGKNEDPRNKSAWDKVFAMVRADGGTNAGGGLLAFARHRKTVEQIILITDEGENGTPCFADALKQYTAATPCEPKIVIIRCPGDRSTWGQIERSLKSKGVTPDIVTVEKMDTISWPNILQLLTGKGMKDLVQDILDLELPDRDSYLAKINKHTKKR
jgi:hypothetical protein